MSRWYAAHVLMVVKRKKPVAGAIPVWENIVLIRADSEDEAFAKAQRHGKQAEGDDDGTFQWAGQPAAWVFAGVRKMTLCEDAEKRPSDGTEITYSQMEFASAKALSDLLEGKPASVKMTDFALEPQKLLAKQTV